MLFCTTQRTTPATEHVNSALGNRRRTIWWIHVHNFHAANINAKMAHLLEEAVVGRCAQRYSHFLACQFGSAVFVNFKIASDNTVVVVRVAHSHIQNLQILTSRCCNHERWHTLAHRQVYIARGHSRRHFHTRLKADPVDFHTQLFVIGAHLLCILKWHWPLEEIGHSDFTVSTSKRSLRTKRKGCTGNSTR